MLIACCQLAGCSILGRHPLQADVTLRSVTDRAAYGQATLTARGDTVQITYDIAGLPPDSLNAFTIDESGNCGGTPSGDAVDKLTRVWTDNSGAAVGFFVLQGLTLDGVRSVVGHALIVQQGTDVGGMPLVCGVITR